MKTLIGLSALGVLAAAAVVATLSATRERQAAPVAGEAAGGPASLECPTGRPLTGRYFVHDLDALLRTGPERDDPPLAAVSGEPGGPAFPAEAVLIAHCELGGRIRVRVAEEGGGPLAGAVGWIEKGAVFPVPRTDLANRLLWDIAGEEDFTEEEKILVRRRALTVLDGHARCGTLVSGHRSAFDGAFVAICLDGEDGTSFTIRLEEEDLARLGETGPDGREMPIPEEEARSLCAHALRTHVLERATARVFALLDHETEILPPSDRVVRQRFRTAGEDGGSVVRTAECIIAPDGVIRFATLGD